MRATILVRSLIALTLTLATASPSASASTQWHPINLCEIFHCCSNVVDPS